MKAKSVANIKTGNLLVTITYLEIILFYQPTSRINKKLGPKFVCTKNYKQLGTKNHNWGLSNVSMQMQTKVDYGTNKYAMQ